MKIKRAIDQVIRAALEQVRTWDGIIPNPFYSPSLARLKGWNQAVGGLHKGAEMAIDFPITVTGVEQREWLEPWEPGMRGGDVGRFVMIRPCNKELNPDGKTFLGLYLGDMRVMGGGLRYNKETQRIQFLEQYGNPAIFVFDLKRVVFGYASWWGIIESEEQLQKITDADIDDVWYVKALRALSVEVGDEPV